MVEGGEPGLGEIGRNVRAIRDDMRSLDGLVRAFQLDLTGLRHIVQENTKDIAELQAEQKDTYRQRATDRRLIFTSLAAPIIVGVIVVVVQVILSARGVV